MKINIPTDRKLRVAVLMGGTSSERPVSLSTGKMILASLNPDKYEAWSIDVPDILTLTPDNPNRPDVVFIALHGKGGEDGTVQGALELLGLPYTGSGVLASALAMNKAMTKRVLSQSNLWIISGLTVIRSNIDRNDIQKWSDGFLPKGWPIFVKPNTEGSTFGCTLVETTAELFPAIEKAFQYDDTVLVEPYICGTEVTVGVLEDATQPNGLLDSAGRGNRTEIEIL